MKISQFKIRPDSEMSRKEQIFMKVFRMNIWIFLIGMVGILI